MSTAVQYWARAIVSNTVVVGAFYLWQFESNEGAGNVFAFLMWVVIALRALILISVAANRTPLERLSRPNGFSTYHWASEFTIICGMACYASWPTARGFSYAIERHGVDAVAATRRAIVRAAAAIGEAMP